MTETWARALLTDAADTIPVGPPADFGQPRGPRWWPLLAAAASVLLVLGLVVALDPGRQDPVPRGPVLQDDLTQRDLPITFGMTTQQATEAVQAVGFDPVVRLVANCTEVAGRVISVDAESGGAAVIRVGDADTGFCLTKGLSERAIAWQLIDMATRRGAGPDRADECCPHEVLRLLASAATHWAPVDGIFNIPPELVTRPQPDGFVLDIGQTINERFRPYESVDVQLVNGRVVTLSQLGIPHSQRQGTLAAGEAAVTGTQEFVAQVRAGKPWPDEGIEMYINGERRSVADGAWNVCPRNSAVFCNINLLDLIRSADGIRQEAAPPDLPCGPATPLRLEGLTAVTLSPTDTKDVGCATWAIQLWWTDAGELRAVDAVLGDP